MVRKSDLPIFDALGLEIHLGDKIMQGMRRGDAKGWDEVLVVESPTSDEILGLDVRTGEHEELASDPALRGRIWCPHEAKP